MTKTQTTYLNPWSSDSELIALIEQHYDNHTPLHKPENLAIKTKLSEIINMVYADLATGMLRVAHPNNFNNSIWKTNVWIKKAIILSFVINNPQVVSDKFNNYFDKIAASNLYTNFPYLATNNIRIIPPAYIRAGAYIGKNTVIMPSFINVGAFIDDGTMIDSWATVGSCAQIGKNVHISAGANIGGVLEPMQDDPTIIEDNCFIGANTAVVEGVLIEKNSVIAAGVILSKSTKIYIRNNDSIIYGRIPSGSVVVPGSLPGTGNGQYHVNCAIIIKTIDEQTRSKTSINELLRS